MQVLICLTPLARHTAGGGGGISFNISFNISFILCLGLGVGIATAQSTVKGFVLEVEAANERGGTLELYFDVGYGYSEHDVVRVAMPPRTAATPL